MGGKVILSLILTTLLPQITAFTLESDNSNACAIAKNITSDALGYYSYVSPGEFKGVHWWISGVAIGSLLSYQSKCNDNSHESIIYESLLAQAGNNHDFEPSWLKNYIGNDDIGAWGLSVMSAAEANFKSPGNNAPSWLSQAQNVFDLLYSRWDGSTCGGGLRWQFDENRAGYSYKAMIANANLFQLAARLAKFTGDSKYTKAAQQVYAWLMDSGLLNPLENGTEVYDGFNVDDNCSNKEKVLWTYNYGTLIAGTGYMYQVTNDDQWQTQTERIILGSQILYNDTVLYERACATYNQCNDDQRVFKAIYSRFMGVAKSLVPSLKSKIEGLVSVSAKHAARSCSGGASGMTCGQNWSYDVDGKYWDGKSSLQEQLSALEAVLAVV